MSIMIVDDNPTNLIIVQEILKKAGYSDFIAVSSANELFRHLQIDDQGDMESPVDLILMDMMMPEIDGIEACRRIQQVDRLKDIPIIIVTALGDSVKLAEALDAGAIDYVTKPINKIELLARIRVALRLKYEKDWHKERSAHILNELELAKQVQAGVLTPAVDNGKVHISAAYQPSFELAGDLYSWYQIDDHRYGVILLDMMGHGISSSLVCMYIASVLRDTITRRVAPEQVIQELNRRMNQLWIPERFVQYYFTAIYLVVDTKSKVIEYVNAGHPPGLLFHGDGQMELLDRGSCAVGFFDTISVETQRISYEDEANIILFTDGLMEEIGIDSEDKLQQCIRTFDAGRSFGLDYWKEKFFAEDTIGQQDDKCLVLVQIHP